MNAQTKENAFVQAVRSSTLWMPPIQEYNPFKRYNPIRPLVFEYNKRVMNSYLGKVMDERFAARVRHRKESSKRSRPIIDLAFESYTKESKIDDSVTRLSPQFRDEAMDHIKVFMFGGHDTSSSTLCFVVYALQENPQVFEKLMREYDDILGKDVDQTASKIKADPYLINRLPYTAACIKEALRLWPPASSVRQGQKGRYIYHEGKKYPTEGEQPPQPSLSL